MDKNKHIGSSLEDLLDREEECNCDQALELKIVLESTQKELKEAMGNVDFQRHQILALKNDLAERDKGYTELLAELRGC